jgi:hypothetical protein
MSTESIVVPGIVRPDGTLEVAGKVPLPPGRVEVTIRAAVPLGGEDLLSFLARIRAEQRASGHVPRSAEQIDDAVRSMREEWDEQERTIERLQEECRLHREASGPATEPPT